jgi:glycosyltransferase involved in cell wall biosynthesis
MRIAFVPAARLLAEHEPNGEALIATSMIRAIAARGHEVLAYCERSLLEPIPGVEVREVPVTGPTVAGARRRFARAIASDIASERIDVAHLLFPFNTEDGYTFVRSAPLVAGPINLAWPPGTGARTSGVRRMVASAGARMERRAHARTLAAATRLLVTGDSSRKGLPEHVHERCSTVPFGVDTLRFLPRPLPERPTILFPSVLQHRKGIETLIRAMERVMHCIPRAHLLVAGADPEGIRPKLEDLAARLGVAGAITFLDPVAPDRMPQLYERASVVCQPSFGEPFGMTVIEAMASGRAVVGTTAGGIPDAVVDGRGGRLVRPGDASLLGDALCSILEHPDDCAEMGAFNRARAEQHYSLNGVIDRIEAVYREVAGRREDAVVAS